MRNFLRLASGINVTPLALNIAAHSSLWGNDRIGKIWKEKFPDIEVEEIMLRYTRNISNDDLQCFWENPATEILTEAKTIALNLSAAHRADQIGRVMLTRLPAARSIPTHSDTNGEYCRYYTRFQIPIISYPGARFFCGDESVEMSPGDVWWANISLPHCIVNDSQADRINLTVDLHIP